MLLTLLFFSISLNEIKGQTCSEPYDLMNDESSIIEDQIKLTDYLTLSGFSYSFWMKYIMLLPSMHDNDESCQIMGYETGFLIWSQNVNGTQADQTLLFLRVQDTTAAFYFYYQDSTKVQKITIAQDEQNLDGLWIFFMITFLPKDKQIIIQKNAVIQTITVTQMISGTILTKFGKQYYVLFGNTKKITMYFFDQFPGLLTQIKYKKKITLPANKIFSSYTNCQMLDVYQEEEIVFVNGIQKFPNGLSAYGEILLQGEKYRISGWVKLDYQRISIVSFTTLLFMRVTINNYYQNSQYFGDRYFYMLYNISQPQLNSTLYLETAHYCAPYHIYQYNQRKSTPYPYDVWQTNDAQYYQQFQQWHYFIYEQARGEKIEENSCIYIFFQSGMVKHCFGQTKYRHQFTNNYLYIFIGQDNFVNQLFIGQVADIKVNFGYTDLKPISYSCHYSCLTCDGPSQNDCLSCSTDQKRTYNPVNKQCQCILGYLEVELYLECKALNDLFYNVQKSQQVITEISCHYGQFKIYLDDSQFICKDCPSEQQNNFYCLDCFIYPETWYLNPLCTMDFIQQQGEGYQLYTRSEDEYDFYHLDTNQNLIYYPQYSYLCNNQDLGQGIRNCFQVQGLLPSQISYVECSFSYFYENGECYKCSQNCLECKSKYICDRCEDQYYNDNNFCQKCPDHCLTCHYNIDLQQVDCQTCEEQYGLLQGKCLECGNFCSQCVQEFDLVSNSFYLRCIQCFDQIQYFFGIKGTDCEINSLINCEYAYHQIVQNNVITTTLDYKFQINNTTTPQIKCARCIDNYAINSTGQCITMNELGFYDCQFAIYIANINDYQCLYGTDGNEFSDCTYYKDNCEICITDAEYQFFFCTVCVDGYYADRITGECIFCPSVLNCNTCFQQMRDSSDNWKINIINYYNTVFNSDNTHSFIDFGQSTNTEDYEILCLTCQQSFNLVNNICIKNCPDECVKCEVVDNQYQCIKCDFDSQGRMLTIIKNTCIQCPIFCELCIERTTDEIQQINQFFVDSTYQSYSQKCVRPIDKNYAFNFDTSLFLDCKNSNYQPCENSYLISLNLYCDLGEYTQAQSLNQNGDQSNIYFEDLLNSNFQVYYNDLFYLFGNQMQISSIRFQIISNRSQVCTVSKNRSISSELHNHIFTLRSQNLEITSSELLTINIQGVLSFLNFKQVILNNIQFVFQGSQLFEEQQIIFNSKIQQYIQLSNIICSTLNQTLNSKFLFSNFSTLQLVIFKMIDFQQRSNPNVFYFAKEDYGQIELKQFLIQQSSFINSTLFFFLTSQQCSVLFQDLNIDTTYFMQATLLNCFLANGCGSIYHSNIILENIEANETNFYQLELFQQPILENIKSNVINLNYGIFCSFSEFITIKNFQLRQSYIVDSQLFINVIKTKIQQQRYNFTDIQFTYNQYDAKSKLYYFQKFSATSCITYLDNLLISENNFIASYKQDYSKYIISLIYMESHELTLSNTLIQSSFSLPIFSFANFTNLIIENMIINQSEAGQQSNVKFQGQKNTGVLFQFYSIGNLQCTNLIINSLIAVNYPIISYKSQSLILQEQNEVLTFENCLFSNNLIFENNTKQQLGVFSITSEQNLEIIITNSKFISNSLITYATNYQLISATLLNFDCSLCSVKFQKVIFERNNAINSTFTIIQIQSDVLIFDETLFTSNGNYPTEMAFLLQQFLIDEQNTFIYQRSGNGYLKAKSFQIKNSNISSSQGSQAGSFIFSPSSSDGSIVIINTTFKNISNYFQQPTEKCGVLFIENVVGNLNGTIFNCSFQDIISLNGGVVQIEESFSSVVFNMKNLSFRNVTSIQGSILKIYFSELHSSTSFLSVENLKIMNPASSYGILMNLINYFDEIEAEELSQQLTKKSLFFTQYAKIEIVQIIILESHNEMLIFDEYLTQLDCFDIQIVNSSFQYFGMMYIISQKNLKFISLSNIVLEDCSTNQSNSVGIINLYELTQKSIVQMRNLDFYNNYCTLCQNGIINIQGSFIQQNQISLEQINIENNYCGKSSCINIQDSQYNSTLLPSFISNRRVLKEEQYQIIVKNYYCQSNTANFGVCIFIVNINSIILNSNFFNNTALTYGGAFLYSGSQKIITFQQSVITDNTASISGGGYFDQAFPQNFKKFQTILINNSASSFGLDFIGIPTHIKMKIFSDSIVADDFRIIQNSSHIIDEALLNYSILILNNDNTNSNKFTFMLPSGQNLNNYQYFNWNTNQYEPLKLVMKLMLYDQFDFKMKYLEGSKCTIAGRLYDQLQPQMSEDKTFTTNFTNIKEVDYDSINEDYNLNDLIIYNDPDLPENLILQLQFQCNQVRIPIYDSEDPNIIVGQSENYFYRVNIRTLPCQLGELKLQSDNSCHPCDYKQDQYSVTLNATQCKIRDNQMMDEVRSAQIKLRTGYWRPYINSEIVENCYNQESNCLGGWNPGDKSCAIGHIGALCEQCDIYNIRGGGSFSVSKKFSCGSCNDTKQNTLIIIGISIWTLISILISVKSTVEIVKQLARATKLKSIGISIVVNKNNAVNLVKILTNYLQIIASVTTFQLSLPKNMDYFINSLGNPVETMAYSLDCFLKDMFKNIEIQYARTIWQLIMPILYILAFFLLYGLGVLIQSITYSFCAISTSLIYIFIYLQPNILAGQIGLLSYQTVSGYKWILGNVTFRYDTKEHATWLLSFCLPVLLIVGLIIPLYFFVRLYRVQNSLNLIDNRLSLGFLYNEYKQIAYYWEVVKIVQKELIIIALTFYSDHIIVKATLTYAIIFIYNYFTILIYPYQQMKLNLLDHLSTRICGLSIVLGIGIYGALKNNVQEVEIPFLTVLALVNFLFVAKLIFEIVQAYFQKFEDILDKARDVVSKLFPDLLKYPYLKRLLRNQAESRKRAIRNFQKIRVLLILTFKLNQNNHLRTQNFSKERKYICVLSYRVSNDSKMKKRFEKFITK